MGDLTALNVWRANVSNHRIAYALLASVVATHMATVSGYWYKIIALLAVLSALLWVPRNFPEFQPGFFTNNLGWKTVIGIFIWHAVYGLHLGALYSPMPEDSAA
jgi:hypothetical protein